MKFVGFTKIKLIFLCTAVFGFAVFGLFRLFAYRTESSLPYTGVAESFSPEGGYTHIAVYFTPDTYLEDDTLKNLYHYVEEKLNKDSIEKDPDHPGARLTASSFIAHGSLTVSSPSTTVTLPTMGVWGDFFRFHEQDLLYGGYFSDKDLNQDYCLLDEEAAWKLYGSSDICGKIMYVGDVPLIIRGVFRQPENKMYTEAGASGQFCYVPYEFLKNHGMINKISCYEIVMPNPVPNYGMQMLVKELGLEEDEIELVENTNRFDMIESIKRIPELKYRAMRTKAVVFPWWENVTRVLEDRISVMNLVAAIGFVYGVLTVLVLIVVLFIQNKDILAAYIVYFFEKIRDSFYRRQMKKRGEL